MKQASLFLLAANVALANPLTYPECGKWNYSVGVENGIEHASQNNPALSSSYTSYPVTFTGYKITSTQTAGYGKWFYLQSRLSYTIGYTATSEIFYATVSTKKTSCFDSDLSVVVPFRISSRQRITLGPQIGAAYMQFKRDYISPGYGAIGTLTSKTSYLAGLAGAVLGLQPTESFGLRVGMNLQFPAPKAKISSGGYATEKRFKAKRHSINAYMNLMYQVSKYLEIAGTLEHKSYSVAGSTGAGATPISQLHRTSATIGAKWVF